MKTFIQIKDKLEEFELVKDYTKDVDLSFEHITYDSRDVKEGSLFFCKGDHFKEEYLEDAIKNGAAAYISEKKYSDKIPSIIVTKIRKTMLEGARYFFDYPDRKLKVIGITGTKGKSTTVQYIKDTLDRYLLDNGKKPCGLISSISIYDGKEPIEAHMTTPESIELYRYLYNSVQNGLEYSVIEISSQSLKYERVGDLDFDYVGIINIYKDHLGPFEHNSEEDYVNSKLMILELSDNIVYCTESTNSDKITNRIKELKNKNVITYAMEDLNADIRPENVSFENGINHFTFDGENFDLSMIGSFNILNAICSLIITKHFGVDYKYAKEAFKNMFVVGRSSVVKTFDDKIVCMVDYAHNDISFTKSFETIHTYFPDYKVISIFGERGGKALNRREEIGIISSQNSDAVYLVPIDPNYEKWENIANEIISHFVKDVEYEIFDTREEGIRKAFYEAKEKTLLFIAGKGHERYQMIEGEYYPIKSDLDVSIELVKEYDEKYNK